MGTTEIAASTPEPAPKRGGKKSNAEAFKAAMERSGAPTRNPESLQGEEPGPIMLKSTPLPPMTSVAEPAVAAPAAPATPVKPEIPADDLARARLAMIRSGMLPSEVDALPAEQVFERGSKRQKAIEADDEAHRHYNEWRARQGQEPKDRKDTAHPLSTEPAAPAPDLKATLEPLAKALLLDDEGLALMERSFRSLVQTAIDPLKAEIGSLRQTGTKDVEQAERVAVETSRARLVDRIPELADPHRFQEVYTAMETLASMKKYQGFQTATETVDALMRDAATIVGLKEVGGNQSNQDEERKRQRAESRTTLPPSSNEAPPQTLRDRQWAYFKHIRENPGDIVGARRVAGYE